MIGADLAEEVAFVFERTVPLLVSMYGDTRDSIGQCVADTGPLTVSDTMLWILGH
jgi:hypothetical protein